MPRSCSIHTSHIRMPAGWYRYGRLTWVFTSFEPGSDEAPREPPLEHDEHDEDRDDADDRSGERDRGRHEGVVVRDELQQGDAERLCLLAGCDHRGPDVQVPHSQEGD